VPPTDAPVWDFDSVLAIVDESLDLAKIRAVDGDLLGQLGQLLPAIYLSVSTGNDAISTNLAAKRAARPGIEAAGAAEV
jgi:hypothetical protein